MNWKILDLSEHNGVVDMAKIAQNGVYGIIQRIGYGTNTIDKTAINNINNALKYGLKVGAYWFTYATNENEALQEAKNFDNYLKQFRGLLELPIYIDFEYDTERYAHQIGIEFSVNTRTKIVKTFCDYLEKQNYFVGVYSNVDYLENRFIQSELKRYSLWLAHWGVDTPKYKCDLWQYTSTEKIRGISGNVDVSILYKDLPHIIKSNNLNGFNSDDTDLNNAINVIANSVIAGKFGNGDDRKNNIYSKVQNRVNEILK